MRLTRHLTILTLLSASLLSACGGTQQLNSKQQADLDAFYAKVKIIMSEKQQSSQKTSESPEEPSTAPARQTFVTGAVKAPGYSGGTITVEVYDAEACGTGYCPAEQKAPLAAMQIPSPGYFSILVPSQGQKTALLAIGGGKRGTFYLGELNTRLDNVRVKLK
ncbi:MAG TPA: hypothetical protein DF383_05140 [Deltaproteobacteria bacterium]|nr:hypothetical protein [Deltaproteobacteria bacterium]